MARAWWLTAAAVSVLPRSNSFVPAVASCGCRSFSKTRKGSVAVRLKPQEAVSDDQYARATVRWINSAVVGLALCPWAKGVSI
jgi:hypothetical protein